jgi:sarcosine oxidase subunit alpha
VRAAGIEILAGHVVTEAQGSRAVTGAVIQALGDDGQLTGAARTLPCDLLASSGGHSAVIHLHSQAGSKAVWNDELATFLPGAPAQSERSAGACAGARTLAEAAAGGAAAGTAAARACGLEGDAGAAPAIEPAQAGALRPLWLVPHPLPASRAPKQFVDFQNDVSAADLLLAVREGFESIEHVKRYTAMGFGTDQGKTGNINGMGIVAQALGKPIPKVGTTTFRPNYTPVTFGALAGVNSARPSTRCAPPASSPGTWPAAPPSRTWGSGSGPGTSRSPARTCTPPWRARCAPRARPWPRWTPPRWARSTSRAPTRRRC